MRSAIAHSAWTAPVAGCGALPSITCLAAGAAAAHRFDPAAALVLIVEASRLYGTAGDAKLAWPGAAARMSTVETGATPRCAGTSVTAIDHVQVTVPEELEGAAKRFYGEVLGLREIAKPAALRARGGAWYQLGATQFHLAIEPGADGSASRRHVCFRTHDLAAMRRRIAAAGCPVADEEPQADGLQRFFTRDPAGNRVEIGARTA
jgi:catechol 2,3-dioxygenase-like lactoylglutathione lyase family enzyme